MHYCCVCKNPDPIWDILVEGGCDASICDKKGNPASYYLEHSSEIELPEVEMTTRRRKSTAKDSEYCYFILKVKDIRHVFDFIII